MPSLTAALATSTPMAPRPMTPSFLPLISGPTKAFLPFSILLEKSSLSSRLFSHSMPSLMFLLAISKAHSVSSLTALALAPGVLKTAIPFLLHSFTGILLTPAPALAIASSSLGNWVLLRSPLLTRIPSSSFISSPY